MGPILFIREARERDKARVYPNEKPGGPQDLVTRVQSPPSREYSVQQAGPRYYEVPAAINQYRI